MFFPPLSNKDAHRCVSLSQGFPSCSNDLCFYFCACLDDLCFYFVPVLMTVVLSNSLKSERLIPPAPFFLLKVAFRYSGSFCFHTNCKNFCSSFVKNALGNSIGIAFNLQIA